VLAIAKWSQKNFARRRPLPGVAGWPKFNQLEMVTTFTYRPSLVKIFWWRSLHAISSYRGNRPTHKQTHRQDRLQYTAESSLSNAEDLVHHLDLTPWHGVKSRWGTWSPCGDLHLEAMWSAPLHTASMDAYMTEAHGASSETGWTSGSYQAEITHW